MGGGPGASGSPRQQDLLLWYHVPHQHRETESLPRKVQHTFHFKNQLRFRQGITESFPQTTRLQKTALSGTGEELLLPACSGISALRGCLRDWQNGSPSEVKITALKSRLKYIILFQFGLASNRASPFPGWSLPREASFSVSLAPVEPPGVTAVTGERLVLWPVAGTHPWSQATGCGLLTREKNL